jgi:hypothetical protein
VLQLLMLMPLVLEIQCVLLRNAWLHRLSLVSCPAAAAELSCEHQRLQETPSSCHLLLLLLTVV